MSKVEYSRPYSKSRPYSWVRSSFWVKLSQMSLTDTFSREVNAQNKILLSYVLVRLKTYECIFFLLIYSFVFFVVDCDLEAINNCMGPFFYEYGLALHNKNESMVCGWDQFLIMESFQYFKLFKMLKISKQKVIDFCRLVFLLLEMEYIVACQPSGVSTNHLGSGQWRDMGQGPFSPLSRQR